MDVAVPFDDIVWRDRSGRRVNAKLRDGVLTFTPRIRSLRDLVVFASGKANYYISKLLNQFWSATSFSFPGTLYMALWTSTLNASSTGSTSGECSYTGYARVAVTANGTNFSTSAGGSAVTNNTAITFGTNAGSLQTATFFAVLDAATTGNLLFWGSITSTAINPGDTPVVSPSGLTSTEA